MLKKKKTFLPTFFFAEESKLPHTLPILDYITLWTGQKVGKVGLAFHTFI